MTSDEPAAGPAPGVRERNRARVEARLLAAAREELRRVGAAALSVRSVARAMDMAPSALFRYIESRDDLLTLLIVDAYDDLGDHVERAVAAEPRDAVRARWRALAHGVRDWAHAHPHQYALLYGSPVPDYHAPAGRTTPAGVRVTDLLLSLGTDAPGPASPPAAPGAPDPERLAADAVAPVGAALPPLAVRQVANGMVAWTSLLGAVSAEVFEHLGAEMAHNDALFEHVVRWGEFLLFGGPDGSADEPGRVRTPAGPGSRT